LATGKILERHLTLDDTRHMVIGQWRNRIKGYCL